MPDHHSVWVQGYRPWFALYGRFLGGKNRGRTNEEGNTSGSEDEEEEPPAPVQQLPDEILTLIFEKLPIYALGYVACVCKQFKDLVEHPRLWELACREAFAVSHPDKNALKKLATDQYRGCWKRLFLNHPHLRFDGLYVSRNTYIRSGVVEFAVRRTYSPVHIVVYFRYYRFFPDGSMLYCTSPSPVASVAKSMAGPSWLHQRMQAEGRRQGHPVIMGRWTIKGSRVWSVIRYPNSWSTEIRSRFFLRSTHIGANNRLDIEMIQSYDRELRIGQSMMPAQQLYERFGVPPANSASFPQPEAEPGEGEAARKQHQRGTNSAVFVPWEQVNTSVLNLHPSQMDMYIPG